MDLMMLKAFSNLNDYVILRQTNFCKEMELYSDQSLCIGSCWRLIQDLKKTVTYSFYEAKWWVRTIFESHWFQSDQHKMP